MKHLIHELCPKGGSGNAVIDGAEELEVFGKQIGLIGRVWNITLTEKSKKYEASCILQTENWKPKKGDKVRFDRQPETVSDDILHATLID